MPRFTPRSFAVESIVDIITSPAPGDKEIQQIGRILTEFASMVQFEHPKRWAAMTASLLLVNLWVSQAIESIAQERAQNEMSKLFPTELFPASETQAAYEFIVDVRKEVTARKASIMPLVRYVIQSMDPQTAALAQELTTAVQSNSKHTKQSPVKSPKSSSSRSKSKSKSRSRSPKPRASPKRSSKRSSPTRHASPARSSPKRVLKRTTRTS